MSRSSNTVVFGSQNPTAPASARPSTADPPVAFPPVPAPAVPRAPAPEPTRPVGADLAPDHEPYVVPTSDRGLAFAAVALALVGVTAAGSYFFFVVEPRRDLPVSTTMVTKAEVPTPAESAPTPEPAPAASAPAPAPAATPPSQPWEPPVVDAVKSPNVPRKIEGPQVEPASRPVATPAPTPAAPVEKSKPRSDLTPSVDEASLERAGFYRYMTPDPATNAMVAPPPAPSPPTTPNTEMVPPLTTPPVIDGPRKTTLGSADTTPSPAPTDTLPDVQIKH